MNTRHHGKHGQQGHRPRDAFELYELEHRPRAFVKVSSDRATSHDSAKRRDLEAFRLGNYETTRALQHYLRPPEDDKLGIYSGTTNAEIEKPISVGHGHHRHRPRDAFELYEREHMPRMFVKVSTDRATSRDFTKPREAFKPDDHENGRAQQHWLPSEDGDTRIHNENIDDEAEEFIASKHEKFELSKWMSMNSH